MGSIEELGLRLVRGTYPDSDHLARNATIFLPEDFPFSVQSLGDTIETIRGLFGDDAWGSMSAGFDEKDGMGIMFYLPQGKEDESLEVVRTADLPLKITQPDSDKPQLKLLVVHDETVLIEPSQVITTEQIRHMIRTRPLEVQEVANGYWRVSLRDGYLKMHTHHGSFGFSRLETFSGVLTPAFPHALRSVTAYINAEDGVRTGTAFVRVKLGHRVLLGQDILDAAATPGFTEIASKQGEVTAEYNGPAVMQLDPINQATALKEIILDFILKLGVFPADADLYISLPINPNERADTSIRHAFGVIAGRYPFVH